MSKPFRRTRHRALVYFEDSVGELGLDIDKELTLIAVAEKLSVHDIERLESVVDHITQLMSPEDQ